jgi:hypothetical protein
MSIPVREMDSYGSAAALQQKKSNKISEQENLSSFGKAEINDSAREDTVKISQEACNRTKEFERTEERKASELKEQEQKNRDSEKRAEDVQREQLRFKEEDWDRIEDERIEDRDVQNENEGRSGCEMESLERVSETEQLEAEREEDFSEHNEEIIAEQEAKIEEENVIRDEEAAAAKAFTASYINNPSSPGNIINVTA